MSRDAGTGALTIILRERPARIGKPERDGLLVIGDAVQRPGNGE